MFGIGSLGIGAKVAIGMGIVMVTMMASFGFYFKYSQDKLAEANQQLAAEAAGRASAEKNIEFMQENIRNQQATLKTLTEESVEIRKDQKKVIDIFAEHDLGKLAAAKPGLIETRVNTGTKRVLTELEELTNPLDYVTKKDNSQLKEEK